MSKLLKKNAPIANRKISIDIDLSDNFKYAGQIENSLSLKVMFRSLDNQCQQIAFLTFVDGLTQDEIGEIMDISRKTVYRKLKLIRNKFQKIKFEEKA